MFWRKELALSERTLREKGMFIEKKREKRDYFSAWALILSFFGSFVLLLSLIFFGTMGKFPQNAILSFLSWIVWNIVFRYVVNSVRHVLYKKDQKIWDWILFDEDVKENRRQLK